MGGLFSSKKKEEPAKKQPNRITEQDKAVLSLKQQRDKLKQYQKKITLNLEKERTLAKQLLKDGKTDKAKTLLKKKRYQENLLTKTDNQLEGIDKMVQDVEFTQVEMKVVEGLKKGNEALKQLHAVMSIDDVERIMEETAEGVEYQAEIDALMAGSLTEEDEDDILKELEELEEMEGAAKAPAVPVGEPVGELPDVPTDEPAEPAEASKAAKSKERQAVEAT